MDEERKRVVEIAKSYIGTPYHHMGQIKGAGVDCLTLLLGVFGEAGLIDKIDLEYYPSDWHIHQSEERYMNGLLRYAHEVSEPKPGDIVLWKFGRCFSHGAIVVEWPLVIHAYTGKTCGYEDALAAAWLTHVGENTTEQGKRRPVKFFSYWVE